MENKYDIYICYSRKDYMDEHGNVIPSNPVSTITRILDAGGFSYFIDMEGIYSGDNFAFRIIEAIRCCWIFLYLSSSNSNQSMWTDKEIAVADEYNKKIIPIRLDNSQYSKRVIFRLVHKDYLDYNSALFEKSLIKAVSTFLGKKDYEELTEAQRKSNIEAAEERRNGAKDYVPRIIDVDIFISYRRVDGRDYARNIMQALKIVGYPKVFFDYNALRDGVFNTQILDAIYSCKDFILIISPLALKNCGREGDWVAREIRMAIKYHKKIIPIVIEDTFQGWPTDFPNDLSSIMDIQFHKLMTDEYFEDSIEKLTKRLITAVSTDKKDFVGLQDLQTLETTHKETVYYKIKVNKRCRLLIDDEEIQIIEPSQLVKLALPIGEYIRKVVAIDDDTVFDEVTINLEHDKADIISLQRKKSIWKRLFG